MKRAYYIRISVLLGVLVAVVAWLILPKISDGIALLAVDRALATSDRLYITVVVPASGHRSIVSLTNPSDIEMLRRLIGARYAQRPTSLQCMWLDLPGCGCQAPEIELVAYRRKAPVAILGLHSSLLTVKGLNSANRRYFLESNGAYRKLCADAGVHIPWEDYGE